MGNSARIRQRSENRPQGGGPGVRPGQDRSQGGGQRPGNRGLQNSGQRIPPGQGKTAGKRSAAEAAHGAKGRPGDGGTGRKRGTGKRKLLILFLLVLLVIILCLYLRSCGHIYGPFRDTQVTEGTENGRDTERGGENGKDTESGSENGRDTEPDTEREYEKDSSGDTQDEAESRDSEDSEKPSGESGAGKERLNLALSDSYRITDKHRVFYIGYPKDNAYDVRFTFLDEQGKELYRTKYVAPGTNVAVDGTAFLSKGEQKLDCRVSVYEHESGEKVSDCTTIVLNIKYE